MARIYVDLTEDEVHWNGDITVTVLTSDGLTGCDMALAIGDHQIVLTINQAITLFDKLDEWMNCGSPKEVGAIRRRIHEAMRQLVDDRRGVLGKLFGPTFTQEAFVHEVEEYLRLNGLRFRMVDDEPAFSPEPRKRQPQSNVEPIGGRS